MFALLGAASAVLALPHGAAPSGHRGLSDLNVTKTAPANAYRGEPFAYTINLTYSGNTLSDEVTVTDALPSGVNFISLDITNGTCSFPQPGTPGAVSMHDAVWTCDRFIGDDHPCRGHSDRHVPQHGSDVDRPAGERLDHALQILRPRHLARSR